jgi:hypothetical protein
MKRRRCVLHASLPRSLRTAVVMISISIRCFGYGCHGWLLPLRMRQSCIHKSHSILPIHNHPSSCRTMSTNDCSSIELDIPTSQDMQEVGAVLYAAFDDCTSSPHVPSVICLDGDLGAGKTAFCRGFIRAATGQWEMPITSPTFLLSNTYVGLSGRDSASPVEYVRRLWLWLIVNDCSSANMLRTQPYVTFHAFTVYVTSICIGCPTFPPETRTFSQRSTWIVCFGVAYP